MHVCTECEPSRDGCGSSKQFLAGSMARSTARSLLVRLTDVSCLHRDRPGHDLRDQPGHGHVLGDVPVDGHGDHGRQRLSGSATRSV